MDNSDSIFLNIANAVSQLSLCTRTRIGCVIVKNDKIISIGYNGNKHCTYDNCYRTKNAANNSEYVNHCIGVHAEWMALIAGNDFENSVMYCSMQPCSVCARMILSSGIKRIVFEMEYHDDFNDAILKSIDVIKLPRVSPVPKIIADLSKMDDGEQQEIKRHLDKLVEQEKYDY